MIHIPSLNRLLALCIVFSCWITVVWAGPQPVFSASELHFGELLQGQTRTKTVVVTNAGDAAYIMIKISSSTSSFTPNVSFGIVEPGDTLLLSVAFAPNGFGLFQADLNIQATTGNTTILMDGEVVLPTTFEYAPDSLFIETPSGSRDTAWITLTNTGVSTLDYTLSGESGVGGTGNGFYEGFENPSADRFTSLVGNYVAERVLDANAPSGSRVLSLTGGNNDAGSGVLADVNDEQFSYAGYWFKPTATSGVGAVMRWWNSVEIIVNIWHTAGANTLTININGSPILVIPCSTDEWHHFEIKNMDHTLRTCDLYLDGKKVAAQHAWNYFLGGVRRIQLSNWDFNTSFFDQIKLQSVNGPFIQVYFPEGEKGSVAAGQSKQVAVAFNAEGVEAGDYEGSVLITNNSQNAPAVDLPFFWKVSPGNKLLLRQDTVDLGKVYVGLEALRPVYWVNAGSLPLLVFSAVATSPELVSKPAYGAVAGLDSLMANLSYTATKVGPVLERIDLQSTGGDAQIWVKAEAFDRPIAHITPDSICLTLVKGQDSTVYVRWENQGLAPLEYQLATIGPAINRTIRVLSSGTASVSKMPAAILRDSSVQVVEMYNTNPVPDFNNFDLVLFPRDGNWDAWPFMSWMDPMSAYVKKGGAALFSGAYNYDLPDVLALMKGGHSFYNHTAGHVQTLQADRPLEVFEGVATPLPYQVEQFAMSFGTGAAFHSWVQSSAGGSLAGYESLGQGKSGFIGYDFQQSSPTSRRLLLNMVRWLTNRSLPFWLKAPTVAATLPAGETQLWGVQFQTDSLSSGVYHFPLTFLTNDPAQPFFTLPVQLMVIAPPQSGFSANKSFTCNGTVRFHNESLNDPTAYTWDFGDGKTSLESNPTHQYTNNGAYDVRLIACNSLGCDTLLRKGFITVMLDSMFCDTLLMPTNGMLRIGDECTGVIYDAGGPGGDYGNGQSGQILLQTAPGTRIQLRVNGYDAACCGDYLQVFDGGSLNAPVLMWTNTSIAAPQAIQSASNQALIAFSTDGAATGKGFSITYQCNAQLPPVAQFVYAPQSCANFIAFQSTSLSADKVYWDFGDNSFATEPSLVHVFKKVGIFQVTLYAIKGADTSSYTLPVKIDQVIFYADIHYPGQAKVNTPVTFSVTAPFPIASISWDINGQFAAGTLPVVATFPQVGTFPVRAIVQAVNGCYFQYDGVIVIGLTGSETLADASMLLLQVDPNPTMGEVSVQIRSELTGPVRWLLTDQLGRPVLSGDWAGSHAITERLDLGGLPSGVYWLSVGQEGLVRRSKLVRL